MRSLRLPLASQSDMPLSSALSSDCCCLLMFNAGGPRVGGRTPRPCLLPQEWIPCHHRQAACCLPALLPADSWAGRPCAVGAQAVRRNQQRLLS